MAGSLKWFNYTATDATLFAVLADESNIEAVNDINVAPITPAAKYKLPGNVKPRRAVYQSADGLVRREIIVLNDAAFAALAPGDAYVDPTSGLTVSLKSIRAEEIVFPTLSDTGLTDGDID